MSFQYFYRFAFGISLINFLSTLYSKYIYIFYLRWLPIILSFIHRHSFHNPNDGTELVWWFVCAPCKYVFELTWHNNVLHSLVWAVCDIDVNRDWLSMIVCLQGEAGMSMMTGKSQRSLVWLEDTWVEHLPPSPNWPQGAGACLTWQSHAWSWPRGRLRPSPMHTEPSGWADSPCSCGRFQSRERRGRLSLTESIKCFKNWGKKVREINSETKMKRIKEAGGEWRKKVIWQMICIKEH